MDKVLAFIVSTWYIWLVAFGIIVYRLSFPKTKGYIGEKIVAYYLSRLDRHEYKVINSLMLKVGDRISQIDHIVVSNHGIFVIETNNNRGWVLGSEDSDYWTRVILKKRDTFHNPIKENYKHIQAIKESLLDFPDVNYISIIAFTKKADVKLNTEIDVVYYTNLKKTIDKYDTKTLTDVQKDDIYTRLVSLNIDSKKNRRAHIKAIKKGLQSKKRKE